MGIPVPGKEGLCMRQGPGLENNHPIVQQPSMEQRRRKLKSFSRTNIFILQDLSLNISMLVPIYDK